MNVSKIVPKSIREDFQAARVLYMRYQNLVARGLHAIENHQPTLHAIDLIGQTMIASLAIGFVVEGAISGAYVALKIPNPYVKVAFGVFAAGATVATAVLTKEAIRNIRKGIQDTRKVWLHKQPMQLNLFQ